MNAAVAVHVDNAALIALLGVNLDGGESDVGSRVFVLLHHLAVVHLVDVIAAENQHALGFFRAD